MFNMNHQQGDLTIWEMKISEVYLLMKQSSLFEDQNLYSIESHRP